MRLPTRVGDVDLRMEAGRGIPGRPVGTVVGRRLARVGVLIDTLRGRHVTQDLDRAETGQCGRPQSVQCLLAGD